MAYLTSLVLKDATNADVTFNRESGANNQVTLRKAGTSFQDAHRVRFNVIQPSKKGRVVRIQREIIVPVYDEDGVLLMENRDVGETFIPINALAAHRDLLAAYAKSLLATAAVQDMIKNIDLPQ